MKITDEDIRNLEYLWEKQLQYRKLWKKAALVIAIVFPLVYIPFATFIPAPWNQIGLVIAMLSVLTLGFLNRVSLITNKFKFSKDRTYRRLLEFAESEDYKMEPKEALIEMEKRRQDAWRM